MRPAASIVLGLGTGRCGTHTLAELLNLQPASVVSHEAPPLLPWRRSPGRPGIAERLRRFRLERKGRLIGDVASFYLPYAEEAIALEPGIRLVCLERAREEVVESFCRWLDQVHPLPTDHWSRVPSPGWYHEFAWTRIFPQYDVSSREYGIRRYWDEYHRMAEMLARRFPENFRVFPIEALNEEQGQRDLLEFVGVPSEHQVTRIGLRSGQAGPMMPVESRNGHAAAVRALEPRHCVVLVPVVGTIAPRCEESLRKLEAAGYAVRRFRTGDWFDLACNQAVTAALLDGFLETFWIGGRIGFEPEAVERFRAHDEAIVCGLYPNTVDRHLYCETLPGTLGILLGEAGGLQEILYGGLGFLLVRRQVYADMQRQLDLPFCDEVFTRPSLPFFQPAVVPDDDGYRSLPSDFAFCHRARQCGYRIFANTTIRLLREENYAYSWEDVGAEPERYSTYYLSV